MSAPVQLFGSSLPVTGAHAPVPTMHVWQGPTHAAEQHTRSSHAPERQSSPTEHAVPGAPGDHISVAATLKVLLPRPPKISTSPWASRADASRLRANKSEGCAENVRVRASKISTVATGPAASPPATMTSPDKSTTASAPVRSAEAASDAVNLSWAGS